MAVERNKLIGKESAVLDMHWNNLAEDNSTLAQARNRNIHRKHTADIPAQQGENPVEDGVVEGTRTLDIVTVVGSVGVGRDVVAVAQEVAVAVEEEGEPRDAVVGSDIAFVGIGRDTYLVVDDGCLPISSLLSVKDI